MNEKRSINDLLYSEKIVINKMLNECEEASMCEDEEFLMKIQLQTFVKVVRYLEGQGIDVDNI